VLRDKNYLIIPLVLAGLVKAAVVLSGRVPFNADEAVVALMARHINQGDFPVFFYGQAYMGSLDALLISFGFRIFGEQIWVIRVIQSLLYLATTAASVELGYRIFNSKKAALLGGILIAVPPVNTVLYTTVSLGGYGELLLIGNLVLLLSIQIAGCLQRRPDQAYLGSLGFAFLWGLLAGLGLWAFGFVLIYLIPSGIYLLLKSRTLKRRKLLVVLWGGVIGGFVLGAIPIWLYISRHGAAGFITELAGGALAGTSRVPGVFKPFVHAYYFLLLGIPVIFGLRPPWSVEWLMLPLIPFVLAFWMGALVYGAKRLLKGRIRFSNTWLFVGVSAVLILGFLLTPFGGDPSGRYFIPLTIPLAFLAARMLMEITKGQSAARIGLISLIVVFNVGGLMQSLANYPPGLTTQFDAVARIDHSQMDTLIWFLRENDLKRGYSNYWVSYPLAFRSEEELIYLPRLPYHADFRYTARDDRYPPYADMVHTSNDLVYITTNHEALNDWLRERFEEEGIEWEEARIGDYQVFFDLSSPLRLDEFGFAGDD
jgi:4-amino-4-deoxy-L-arabinose transferase-like glycosyltransferase